jgi:hypothetical protein
MKYHVPNRLCWFVLLFAGLLPSPDALGQAPGDKPPPYPGGPTAYDQVSVPAPFTRLIGVWEGPFRAYDLSINAFRPYTDRLVFFADACFKVTSASGTGDILLVGTLSDAYPEFRTPTGTVLPAKSENGFLIYGLKAGDPNQVFIRTVRGGSTTTDYVPEYALEAARVFVYRAVVPAEGGQPQLTFHIFGAQDPMADDDSRYFAITLTVGPDDSPFWQGIIVGGQQHHQPPPPGGPGSSAAVLTPRAPGKSSPRSTAGAMDVHKAMDVLRKHDKGRRALGSLMTTISPG